MMKELQKKAIEHANTYDKLDGRKEADVPTVMVHLMEELGELSQEIYNEMSGRKEINMMNLKDGIADIFIIKKRSFLESRRSEASPKIMLSLLAEKYSIDMEKEVIDVMKKDMDELNGLRR